MTEVDRHLEMKCSGCCGTYVPTGQSGVLECAECGDEIEKSEALIGLTEHRKPLEEIANSAATDAHVARVILAALDGEKAPPEDIDQLVDFGAEQ